MNQQLIKEVVLKQIELLDAQKKAWTLFLESTIAPPETVSALLPAQCLFQTPEKSPAKRRLRWTPKLDRQLMELSDSFGKNFTLVAEHMDNRTPTECSHRYQRLTKISSTPCKRDQPDTPSVAPDEEPSEF